MNKAAWAQEIFAPLRIRVVKGMAVKMKKILIMLFVLGIPMILIGCDAEKNTPTTNSNVNVPTDAVEITPEVDDSINEDDDAIVTEPTTEESSESEESSVDLTAPTGNETEGVIEGFLSNYTSISVHGMRGEDEMFDATHFNLFDFGQEMPHILIDYTPLVSGFSMRIPNVLWEYNNGQYSEVRWRITNNLDHDVLDGGRFEFEGETFDNRRLFNESIVRLIGLFEDANGNIIGHFQAGAVPVGFDMFSQLDLSNLGYINNVVAAIDWDDWENADAQQAEFNATQNSLSALVPLRELEASIANAISQKLIPNAN